VRRFGTDVSDLDVDFTCPPPFLVTDLLKRCGSLSEDAAWDLSVGARTEAIVTLAILSESHTLTIGMKCPHAGCGEALEIEIGTDDLHNACSGRERESATVRIGERSLELRRPTGRDQRNWLGTQWPDLQAARTGMIASLMHGPVDELRNLADGSALEAELAAIDPLVDFNLTVACPACGATAEHTIDLEKRALWVLRRIHDRMFESVTRLAIQFHWTEDEIFALPLWRRERYLALADMLR